MTQAILIDIDNQDRLSGIRSFLATVMDKAGIAAMLVPTRLAVKNRIMPTLCRIRHDLKKPTRYRRPFRLTAPNSWPDSPGCRLAAGWPPFCAPVKFAPSMNWSN
jgi:hypothetical protein